MYQGSNSPLRIRISGDVAAMTNISVLLHDGTTDVKEWEMVDLTIEDGRIFAPLTEAETLAFPTGNLTLEVKWSDGDGIVHIEPLRMIRVEARLDKAVISTMAVNEEGDNGEDSSDGNTDNTGSTDDTP